MLFAEPMAWCPNRAIGDLLPAHIVVYPHTIFKEIVVFTTVISPIP